MLSDVANLGASKLLSLRLWRLEGVWEFIVFMQWFRFQMKDPHGPFNDHLMHVVHKNCLHGRAGLNVYFKTDWSNIGKLGKSNNKLGNKVMLTRCQVVLKVVQIYTRIV